MFVHYHGTKAGFVSKGYSETYKNCIVFIKGSSSGKGECIYTHGNYFASFNDLISTLCFVKGVVIDGTKYNTVEGGGYLNFSGKDTISVGVNTSSGSIEISLSDDFKNNISRIEQTLTTISSDYLKQEDRAELENLINSTKSEILGNVTEEYNSLEKIETKLKDLKESLKITDIIDGQGTTVENNSGIVGINISIDDESIGLTEGKLSVKLIDGGKF